MFSQGSAVAPFAAALAERATSERADPDFPSWDKTLALVSVPRGETDGDRVNRRADLLGQHPGVQLARSPRADMGQPGTCARYLVGRLSSVPTLRRSRYAS